MNKLLLLCMSLNLIGVALMANNNSFFDAAFGYSYQNCSSQGVTIAFEDQSNTAGITGWLWEFSDGQSSTLQNPVITVSSSQMLGVRLTITSAAGTESTTQTLDVVVMEEVQLPGSLLLCPGGAIPINPRGNSDYSYSWSPTTGLTNPNAINPLASPSETTTYTVTITDDSGSGVCEQIKSVTVTVPPEIPFTLGEDYSTCEDEVTLTVDTDPINTINWFDVNANKIGSGNTIVVVPVGRAVYFVEIIDEPGCSVKDAIVVTKVDPPTVVAQPNNPSCAGESSGSATAIANGGTPPYNYAWSNGGTGVTIDGLAPGEYTVTATDANGCTGVSTITVTETSSVTVSTSTPGPICAGANDGSATAAGAGGTAPYSYNWSNGQTTATASGLTAGTYTVTATDANGCTAENSVTVDGTPPVSTTTASTDETKENENDGTAIVTAGGGTAPYTYAWSNGANTAEVSGLAPGTYTVTITDANGCTATATVVIAAGVSINITPKVTGPDCGGECSGEIDPEVTGGNGEISYSWNDGSTDAKRTGLCAGDYALTVTDADGNTQTTSVTIAEPDPVQASISSNSPAACTGEASGSASVNASGGTAPLTYSWSNGATTKDLSDLAAGDYILTVTDANGCTETTSLTISEPPPVTALSSANFDPCATDNNSVSLSGTSNATDVVEWNWTLSDGTSLTGQNPTFDLNGASNLTATLSIVTADGCTATAPPSQITIEEFMPSELQESRMACAGASTELNPDGDGNLTYTWSPAGGLNDPNSANPVATVNETTDYSVTISNGSCEVVQQTQVMVPPPIELAATGDTSLCETTAVDVAAAGTNFTSLEWSDDPNFTNILGTDPNLSVMPDVTTTYYVKATDAAGCTSVDQVTIENSSLDVALSETASVCSGDETMLQDQIVNQNPNQVLSYDWMDPDNIITGGADTGSPTVNAAANSILNVTISNESGCELNADVSVEVVDIESVEASADPTEVFAGSETQLNATGPSGATFSWSPSTGLDNPNIANPVATPDETTTYTVTIETPEGCATTRTVTVTVSPVSCEEPFVFFPNAFTPNGDGENDVLFLRGNSITSMYFAVFNRFGEKVFESRSLNSGWDGRFQGEPVCPDVYGYYLEATCVNGDNFFKQGNVTVLK